jgi:hypothetical protein
MLQIEKLRYFVHVINNNGILDKMCSNKETGTAPSGFMFIFITVQRM